MIEKTISLPEEAKKTVYYNKIIELNNLAKLKEKSGPEEAYRLSKKAYKLAKQYDYITGKADSLLNMAYACRILSKYEESMFCLNEALQIYVKEENNEKISKVYNLLGINYFYFGDYKKSLTYFRKCLELRDYINNEVLLTGIYNNIGEIHRKTRNYKQALMYYDQALDIIKEKKDLRSIGVLLLNKGMCYQCLRKYGKAIESYNNGLVKLRSISDNLYIAMCLNGIGETYFLLEQYEVAEKNLKEALVLYRKQNNKYYQIEVLVNLAKLYREINDIVKSYKYMKSALYLAKSIEAKDLQAEIYKETANYYELKSNYKEALKNYRLYNEMKEEIKSEELNKKLESITIDFRVQKAKQEAEIYRLKNVELKQKSEELEEYSKRLEDAKEELQKLINSRDRLFSDISHDLRTPVAAIRGYTEALIENVVPEEHKKEEYLKRILDKTNTLNTMINDLFELTKLESGQMKFNFKSISSTQLFNWIKNRFSIDMDRNGKELILENNITNLDKVISVDIERINRVFSNIIENAINHGSCSKITIVITLENSLLRIEIKDDGVGINPEDIAHVFERFYKASKSRSPSYIGSGLGLAISKEIIKQHGGEIWVESEKGKGSSFIFTLPTLN